MAREKRAYKVEEMAYAEDIVRSAIGRPINVVCEQKVVDRTTEFLAKYPNYRSLGWGEADSESQQVAIGSLVGDLSCIAEEHGPSQELNQKVFGSSGIFKDLNISRRDLRLSREIAQEVIETKLPDGDEIATDTMYEIYGYLEVAREA